MFERQETCRDERTPLYVSSPCSRKETNILTVPESIRPHLLETLYIDYLARGALCLYLKRTRNSHLIHETVPVCIFLGRNVVRLEFLSPVCNSNQWRKGKKEKTDRDHFFFVFNPLASSFWRRRDSRRLQTKSPDKRYAVALYSGLIEVCHLG
jgi:hypothetical protein